MPGDVSSHTKYSVKLPYPEVKVEEKNQVYANLLLEDYAGMVSELTAINLYVYQHIIGKGYYEDYAELIGGVSISEMKHLELLAKTISLLGVKPVYTNSICPCNQVWTAKYVNFDIDIKNMILEDIRSEEKAINQYNRHICLIDDKYIKKLLNRIILDEELHLKYFNKMCKKYCC